MAELPAGKRDRRIRIERQVEVGRDDLNAPVVSWTPHLTVWAEKLDLSDRERLASQEVGAEITTRFRILWSEAAAEINAKDRIVFGGRIYDIFGVKELGRREGLEITATARADK